jgi:isocitrate dehydrogenase (NAD+)
MLRHMGLHDYATKIESAVLQVLKENKYITRDLGGSSSTTDYSNAIIDLINKNI